jgi:hypothetical protein
MDTDVRSKNLTATGAMGTNGRCRIKAIYFAPTATAGSVSIKDGGSSGTEIIKVDTNSGSTTYMLLPSAGVLSLGDPYVTLTTTTSVTIFYT